MKKLNKQLALIAMTFTMAVSVLSGCGKKFDAATYVKGTLDANFKNEISDDYAKLVEGGKEAVQKQYDEDLDTLVQTFKDAGCPDDILDSYKDVFVKLLKQCKYTVGEVKEDGDNFIVSVEVEPMDLDWNAMQSQSQDYLIEWIQQLEEEPTEDVIIQETFTYMLSLFEEAANAPQYKEKQTVDLNVVKGSDNVYSINTSDVDNMTQMMLGL